jgi:hypothetical protein
LVFKELLVLSSESGVLRVSTGIIWAGLNRNVFPTFNTSSGNTFSIFYRDGGAGFTETQNNVQLNNLFYDDGSGIQLLYLIVDTHLILYLHHLVGCFLYGSNEC